MSFKTIHVSPPSSLPLRHLQTMSIMEDSLRKGECFRILLLYPWLPKCVLEWPRMLQRMEMATMGEPECLHEAHLLDTAPYYDFKVIHSFNIRLCYFLLDGAMPSHGWLQGCSDKKKT